MTRVAVFGSFGGGGYGGGGISLGGIFGGGHHHYEGYHGLHQPLCGGGYSGYGYTGQAYNGYIAGPRIGVGIGLHFGGGQGGQRDFTDNNEYRELSKEVSQSMEPPTHHWFHDNFPKVGSQEAKDVLRMTLESTSRDKHAMDDFRREWLGMSKLSVEDRDQEIINRWGSGTERLNNFIRERTGQQQPPQVQDSKDAAPAPAQTTPRTQGTTRMPPSPDSIPTTPHDAGEDVSVNLQDKKFLAAFVDHDRDADGKVVHDDKSIGAVGARQYFADQNLSAEQLAKIDDALKGMKNDSSVTTQDSVKFVLAVRQYELDKRTNTGDPKAELEAAAQQLVAGIKGAIQPGGKDIGIDDIQANRALASVGMPQRGAQRST